MYFNEEKGDDYMLCPKGHRVYIRAWNRFSDPEKNIIEGRRCQFCNEVYSIRDLRGV
jgi:hypothetical protein